MDTSKKLSASEEYSLLSTLEQTTTSMRYSVFTAILSVSFLIPALGSAVNDHTDTVCLFQKFEITIFSLLFSFGFIFYCLAVFHYWWYHRYSHMYRKRLKQLEQELGIQIYSLRTRPQKNFSLPFKHKKITVKMHFDWALYIVGLLYAAIDISLIGIKLFLVIVAFVFVLYILFVLLSSMYPTEPLEVDSQTNKP